MDRVDKKVYHFKGLISLTDLTGVEELSWSSTSRPLLGRTILDGRILAISWATPFLMGSFNEFSDVLCSQDLKRRNVTGNKIHEKQ